MTVSNFFNKLKILYITFVSCLVSVSLIALYFNNLISLNLGNAISNLLAIGVLLIGMSTVALSFIIFKFFTSKIDSKATLDTKLSAYFRGYILRAAMIEGMALLTAITFALTSVNFLLIVSVLYVGLLIFLKPSKKEVKHVFKLSINDQVALDNNETVLI